MLRPKEKLVLETVEHLQSKNGQAPRPGEIANELGYDSASSVSQAISVLVSYGCLARVGGNANRRIEFLNDAPTIKPRPKEKPLPVLTKAQKQAWFRSVMNLYGTL